MPTKNLLKPKVTPEETKLPTYQKPQVLTYTDEEILEELGPAQAVYGPINP